MNELTDLMERSTDDLRPDVAALVAGGMTRGRRMRVRRRLATGAGVLTAVTVVGAGAFLVPSVVAGSDGRPPSNGTTVVPAASVAPPRELPSKDALANGSVVSLPGGQITLIDAWGRRSDGFVAAAWRFTPAAGGAAGRVEVIVEDAMSRGPGKAFRAETYSPGRACRADGGTCRALPDGSWLSTFTMPEPLSGGGDSEIVGAHASLWTPDGLLISATAYNAMGEKHTAVTRSTPVLDEAQLAALVRGANLG